MIDDDEDDIELPPLIVPTRLVARSSTGPVAT
jgi:hypothetical protein